MSEGWYLHVRDAQDADILVLALAGLILSLSADYQGLMAVEGDRIRQKLFELRRARIMLSQISDAICRGEFRTTT